MHRTSFLALIALLLFCALAAPASAKEPIKVLLKDGTTIKGVLVKETSTSIIVELTDGTQREISASEISDYVLGEDDDTELKEPEYPKELYEEDDVKPQKPTPPEPQPESKAPEAPKATDDAGDAKAPAESPAKKESAPTLTLNIPEVLEQDCSVCAGYKVRTCWVCAGDSEIGKGDEPRRCTFCKAGKTLCEPCGGSGDAPDPARAMDCPGCTAGLDFSFAPGKWSCPSCNGRGTYSIIGGAKEARCAVCKGDCTFNCTICGGAGLVYRMFPPAKKAEPEAWRTRCEKGIAAIDASGLSPDRPVGLVGIEVAGRTIPGLKEIAKRLQEHLDRAQGLEKNHIEGSQEAAAFFSQATGATVLLLLAKERARLVLEQSWLVVTPAIPGR